MTLRRYTPLASSMGTPIPGAVRLAVRDRDQGCIGPRIGLPGACAGPAEPDHIRASGALGKKSPSTVGNLATLCRYVHHRYKTENGRLVRPKLIAWVEAHAA